MSHSGAVAIVLGTRPEIIKLAGIIRALGEEARVIHTGQHYDESMSGQFFAQLGIGEPDVVLDGIGGTDRGTQIARGIAALTQEFIARRPAAVIVQGDTNAVSAGAQAASYLGIPLIHVEAGLRSYDRSMPEETNRLVAGVLADVHCAATESNMRNLLAEGVTADRIVLTGNTVVEATLEALEQQHHQEDEPYELPESFALATIHRPENTDTEQALRRVLEGLHAIDLPVVFPVHPRTAAAITQFDLQDLTRGKQLLEPVGHAQFLHLASRAKLLVADSGGIQEECTVLKKPLLVIRRSTERPEAIDAGFATLVPPTASIADAAAALLKDFEAQHLAATPSPYGDGTASKTIADLARTYVNTTA